MSRYVLGFDSSTQSLSAVLLDLDQNRIAAGSSVNFDEDLPEYNTVHGVLPGDDCRVAHAPPLVWVAALDRLFHLMRENAWPLAEVKAVSGSGQQHGSVYLNGKAGSVFGNLDPGKSLAGNLADIFSRTTSPVWMDSSTSAECAQITAGMGGDRAMAEATGSIAFERFTGPQIRKFHRQEPDAYRSTDKVALVSSFMASVLGGELAPIDHGDGAGMNLMDIRTRAWCEQALQSTAPGLRGRLPGPAESWRITGKVNPYFADKYGLAPDALNVIWSGDNPCSLVGLGLFRPGDWSISLGTSDTLFGLMRECRVDVEGQGHVFVAPTGDYMSLICFKNGSLARERVRDAYGLDWDAFSAAIGRVAKGNDKRMMLPYFEPEIVPKVLTPGVRRFDLDAHDVPANCRAVVEAQMMSMRNHSSWMGTRPDRIYATGGASRNAAILQIMADVFQSPVISIAVENSAALGAAFRAAHAWHLHAGSRCSWEAIVEPVLTDMRGSTILPDASAAAIYDELCRKYAVREMEVVGGSART